MPGSGWSTSHSGAMPRSLQQAVAKGCRAIPQSPDYDRIVANTKESVSLISLCDTLAPMLISDELREPHRPELAPLYGPGLGTPRALSFGRALSICSTIRTAVSEALSASVSSIGCLSLAALVPTS